MTLRNLYLTRFGFAVVWAGLLAVTAKELSPFAIALLVLYPLVDVAAAVVDVRSSGNKGLYLNIAMSALAAIGLAVAAGNGIPAVLRVFGAWAVVAGVIQLVVGASRRKLGGQWAMILSGAGSVAAGSTFIAGAGREGASLSNIAGYAVVGGVLFLISALRLGRAARAAKAV
ncbi:hypothetical protein [Actinoplanes sp. NPDC049265]|uniref:hypothetical protein n=1 Tax=Actinoplanes sp. NPDC049265 TaxID=3363902 RepID=UPI00371478B8